MKKYLVRIAAVGVLAAIAVGAAATHASAATIVKVRGGLEVAPNEFIADTLRFAPGTIAVRRGHWVRWVNAAREQTVHTITVVQAANVPVTVAQVNSCPICALALGHLADPSDPQNSGIKTLRLNVGAAGFNTQGDSLFLRPHKYIAARITARPGRILHYICAIHPWMQGKILVRRASATPVTGKRG